MGERENMCVYECVILRERKGTSLSLTHPQCDSMLEFKLSCTAKKIVRMWTTILLAKSIET
jgi:hypothetical protein